MKPFNVRALCHTRKLLGATVWDFNSHRNILSPVSYSTIVPATKVEASTNYVKQKFNDLVVWYEQVTGMDEVRMMQNRVIEAQDRFVDAQDKRRDASKALATIQAKLKDIYAELDSTSRGEERYLQLITEEHSVLKEERKLQSEFIIKEKEERESFTLLSNCVKESHEKERAQAERTKYWSVIGSVIGTIIGILGSSINNEFKMREIRSLVKETTSKQSPELTSSLLSRHEKELATIVTNIKSVMGQDKEDFMEQAINGKLDQLLHTVSSRQRYENNENIVESIHGINQNVQELKSMVNTAQRIDGHLLAFPTDLEGLMIAQRNETRLILAGVAVVSFLVPVLVSICMRP